ncbi:MAG: hypothetical protein OEZ16_11730 [Chromatiales bacterium]|nr:hypothetical protein [Chromatiales bacterium]
MAYDNIHNITSKAQNHTLVSGEKIRQVRATTYEWDYTYGDNDHPQPHAPTHIGDRTFKYDANGNQLGWDHDKNGTRRNITWDDENRIQKIGDPSNTLEFAYDDGGERMMKRGQHGMSVYINQYFTVRNLALASKHVYAGTTRIATKVEPGQPVGYRDEPLNFATTSAPQEEGIIASSGQAYDSAVTSVKGFFGGEKSNGKVKEGHPGQGLAHRSDRANEVARNTEKNKHLNGGVPGGERGNNGNRGGNGQGNNGNGNGQGNGGGNGGNTNTGNGGGNSKAPYDYGGSFLYYYHPDHLGSTSYVTDSDGEIYEHVQYFPFGETWVQEAANTLQRVPYRFTSKELDEETGLYYYGARYYDPRTSVWQSADPILGSYLDGEPNGGVFMSSNLSLYSYVANAPLTYIDPTGMYSVETLEGGSVNLVVVEGDTLSGMMSDLYNGNGPSWQWAAERNNLDNADLIHPGQRINLAGSGVPVDVPERRWAPGGVIPGPLDNGAYMGTMRTGFKNQHSTMMRAPCASSGCLMHNANFNINDPYNSAGIGEAMHKEDVIFAGGMVTATGLLGGGWGVFSTVGTYGIGITETIHHRSATYMVEPLSGSAIGNTLNQAGYKPAVSSKFGGVAGFLIGIHATQ